jgi:hypothetical protein
MRTVRPASSRRALQAPLGQKLVAFALREPQPKTIGRYARGERSPDDQTLRRLIDLYTIVRALETALRRQAVRSWMLSVPTRTYVRRLRSKSSGMAASAM